MAGSLVRPWSGQAPQSSEKRPRLVVGIVEDGGEPDRDDPQALAKRDRRQALIRLVQQRSSQVRQIQEQLAEACKKLADAEAELADSENQCQLKSGMEKIAPLTNTLQKVKRESGSNGNVEEKPVNGAASGKPQLLVPGISMQNVKSGPNFKAINVYSPKTTVGASSLQPPACTNESEFNLSSISSKQTDMDLQPTPTFQVEQSDPDISGISMQNIKSGQNSKVATECSPETNVGATPCANQSESNISSFSSKQTTATISQPVSTFQVEQSKPNILCKSSKPGGELLGIKSEAGCSLERSASSTTEGSKGVGNVDLVARVCSDDCSTTLKMLPSTYIPSQHKRKLRSLAINHTMHKSCATSALDGVINLWQVQGKGMGLSLVGTIDCLSPGQRRWPDDMVWHPSGEILFACYSADAKDHQVAIIDPATKKASFLDEKPHEKGIVNSIVFMPWVDYVGCCFVTGGCDHAVVIWKQEDSSVWRPSILHRSLHSSAVMAVAGLRQREQVLSVGADKRIVAFDVQSGRAEFRYQLESKAMGVSTNPSDANLFMVQTGTPGQQIRLFDIRAHKCQLHAFGWRQESSESQSALINQTWSSDGLYIASGSADPKIHIFDIRYDGKDPLQTIRAHQKRVFKAAWHHSLPLLLSISSDLNIGIHRISV